VAILYPRTIRAKKLAFRYQREQSEFSETMQQYPAGWNRIVVKAEQSRAPLDEKRQTAACARPVVLTALPWHPSCSDPAYLFCVAARGTFFSRWVL
jgi:hypothetical protein